MFGPCRGECGAQGGVTEDHRDIEFGCQREVSVIRVALDDHHVVAGFLERAGHPDAERTETNHDEVCAEVTCLLASGRLRESSGHQHVGDE